MANTNAGVVFIAYLGIFIEKQGDSLIGSEPKDTSTGSNVAQEV
jgi:hypothetical protein